METLPREMGIDDPDIGNVRSPERSIYTNYTEVSPWDSSHSRRYKPVRKPFYKYFSGTMPDLHYRIRDYPALLLACGILRALGLWMGISNPVLGLFVLTASLLDSYINSLYICWGLAWMTIWSLVMRVPRELIYNGLYPVQGMLLSLLIYIMQDEDAQLQFLLPNLGFIILLQLLNLFLFQALCAFFVKVLNVSPLMISPTVTAILYKAIRQRSTYFNHVSLPPAGSSSDIITAQFFNGTFTDFTNEVGLGVSNMVFSYNQWSGFVLTVGMLIVSPILGVMSWMGSLTATITALLVAPEWAEISARAYIFPAVITCGCIGGTFFVLSIHSFFVAVAASSLTALVTIGISSLFEPIPCWITGALGGYLVTTSIYCTAGSFPNLIPVDLMSITTPEDHLKRYYLSKKILRELVKTKGHKKLSVDNIKSVERSILPILMCSYAKTGNVEEMKMLLDLGADPKICNYNGRCALHIAAAEDQMEMVQLLIKYQADVNQCDVYDGTALTAALQARHFDLAYYLYKKGARIQFKKSKMASLLCYMVHEDDVEQLQAWLKCGAQVSARSWNWQTPLSVAISQDKKEMIEILKAKDEGEKSRRTSIDKKDHVVVIENAMMTSEVVDYDKLQLREERVRAIRNPAEAFTVDGYILKAVIMSIMDDEVKRTALLPSLLCQLAYIKDNESLREVFLEDFNAAQSLSKLSDYDLRTPLHIAAHSGNLEAVKILVWNKADINKVDRFGTTPLLEAIRTNSRDVITYLLSCGAELGISHRGQVAELCWAVYNSDYDMFDTLLQCGVDVTLTDYDGRSFMDVARDMKNENMLDHIEKMLGYNT